MSSRPPVEIRVVGARPGRPPQNRLSVDVVLRNDHAEPRWFIFPTNLPPPEGGGGVDTLEILKLSGPEGKGRAVVGRFLGSGGFQVALVPAGAQLTLRGLPLSVWGNLAAKLSAEVVVAKDFTIGGAAARSWFSVEPLCDAGVDATGDDVVATKKSADGAEVPVAFESAAKQTIYFDSRPSP